MLFPEPASCFITKGQGGSRSKGKGAEIHQIHQIHQCLEIERLGGRRALFDLWPFITRVFLSSGSRGSAGIYLSCNWAKATSPEDMQTAIFINAFELTVTLNVQHASADAQRATMQQLMRSSFKRTHLAAGGIADVRGWPGKVRQSCGKWQPSGSKRWALSYKPSLDPVNPVGHFFVTTGRLFFLLSPLAES